VAALNGPQDAVFRMLDAYRQRRDFVVRRLRAIPGVTCLEPQGSFYAYPNIAVALGRDGIHSTMQLAERLLEEARVAVVPGEAFGTASHIRISYAASMEELERGLGRLHEFLTRLRA
jgi:aspartate aminotransferase